MLVPTKLVSLLLLVISFEDLFVSSQGVFYVKTSQVGFLVAHGKAGKSEDATRILTKDVNNCTCKQACFAVNCMAWSVVAPQNGPMECRLDTLGPANRTLEDNHDATYFFKEESIRGTYQFSIDKLLYLVLDVSYTFSGGREMCSRIPGHRLVIIKTLEQLAILTQLKNTFNLGELIALNLEKKRNTQNTLMYNFDVVWGDGTRFVETQLPTNLLSNNNGNGEDIYLLHQNKFHDSYDDTRPHHYFRIICQANPLQVVW